MAATVATFRDSTAPDIGMLSFTSHRSRRVVGKTGTFSSEQQCQRFPELGPPEVDTALRDRRRQTKSPPPQLSDRLFLPEAVQDTQTQRAPHRAA